jgi:fermentation-respiration switch protein FrsA (DUF1100 family)
VRVHWRDKDMSAAKWFKAVGLILAMFLLVYLVAKPLFHAYVLTHPRRWMADLTGSDAGAPVERIALHATDGVELVGWFVPGNGTGATIVVSHGSGANGAGTYPLYAYLNRAGYNVFVFDHRAHGQSGGQSTTLGPLEVRDLLGAVAYLHTRTDVDADRIGAIGCSMGSGVVIGAAAHESSIRGVVAEAVYADTSELWDRFGYVGVRGTPVEWSWGPLLRWATWLWTGQRVATFRPEALVGRISPRSVLIIHGERDNAACTTADAHRLYQAAGPPKDLWIAPGAGHCSAHASWPEEYEARVLTFFGRALAVNAGSGQQ